MSTRSSVPGGLFAPPPNPQVRERLDGRMDIKGKGNSSSIVGGLFGSGAEQMPDKKRVVAQPQASAWEGCAGGRSNSNAQFLEGHFRGGTAKDYAQGQRAPAPWAYTEGAAGGASNSNGQLLEGHYRGGTSKSGYSGAPRRGGMPSAQKDDDDFLSRLEQAEEADDEHAQYLAELETAAKNEQVAREAAAQIAAENGLGPQEERQLAQRILANLRQKMAQEAAAMEEEEEEEEQQQSTSGGNSWNQQQHYAAAQQNFSPPRDHVRRPGQSPRVSGKPTAMAPPRMATAHGVPAMAAGGYRASSASFSATASSIAGGIFG